MTKRAKGFTIVELLIVIVIIAILAAISIVAYNGVQERARDAKRAEHIALMKKTVLMYDAKYGGVPRTTTAPRYNSMTASQGNWDASTNPDWLAFLNDDYGEMPVDPVNYINPAGAGSPANGTMGHNLYLFYCYAASGGDSAYARLGYFNEDRQRIFVDFEVSNCV